MKCHRCGSMMVYEKFYGPHEHFVGWKCILCGEIIDQVIQENRHAGSNGEHHLPSPSLCHCKNLRILVNSFYA